MTRPGVALVMSVHLAKGYWVLITHRCGDAVVRGDDLAAGRPANQWDDAGAVVGASTLLAV